MNSKKVHNKVPGKGS